MKNPARIRRVRIAFELRRVPRVLKHFYFVGLCAALKAPFFHGCARGLYGAA
jgi:hypothetical protein